MSKKTRRLAEAAAATAVAEAPAPVLDDAVEEALGHAKTELANALGQLSRRADLQGGDAEAMAIRTCASMNGALSGNPALRDAYRGVLIAKWEAVKGMPAEAGADVVTRGVRKELLAALVQPDAVVSEPGAPVSAGAEPSVTEKKTVSANPALDTLMALIDEVQAPDAVVTALRRDIGGLGNQLKDARVTRTAKKSIAKVAGKYPGNEALLAKLG